MPWLTQSLSLEECVDMAKYKYGKKFKATKGRHKGKLVQYRYTGGRKNTKTMVRAKR